MDYVHGSSERDAARLNGQARTLEQLPYADTGFPGRGALRFTGTASDATCAWSSSGGSKRCILLV